MDFLITFIKNRKSGQRRSLEETRLFMPAVINQFEVAVCVVVHISEKCHGGVMFTCATVIIMGSHILQLSAHLWRNILKIVKTGLLPPGKACCRNYFKRLFSFIDAPVADVSDACLTVSNILLKAFVLNNSDRERELGCLRRKEKLSSKT